MSKVEEMLHELLRNQRKLLDDVAAQAAAIGNIEERLDRIENESVGHKESKTPPSLVRVLKGLADEGKPTSAEEAAKRVNLSRNLTSGYLNRLAELGYAVKEPNMEGRGARYLFKVNYSAVPDEIKRILKKYES